jgi:glycosyltransferase involved in cell wall biosynthesis
MRVLFAVHGYKPAWRIGGPVVSVPALAEALVRRGHNVSVVTTNSNLDQRLDVPTDRFIDVDGVRVRYFQTEEPLKRLLPKWRYFSQSIGTLYAPEMSQALREIATQVDLVHTHLPFVYPTMAAARAAFKARLPLFYHQRGVLDPERLKFRSAKKKLYLSLVERPILRRATTLIALTEAERASYAAQGVTAPCRVIPNGIDQPAPLPAASANDALAALGIGSGDQILLFMGRLHPVKGADRLFEAFLRVARRFPAAKLVLAGPDEVGAQTALHSRAQAAGLATRVVFPGMVTGSLKSALLARADLFCLPSDAEGFSMAILEALVHSTAVLISPGCHFERVETAGAGCIAAPTADAIESALDQMLRDPVRLREMGEAGRILVLQHYTWDRVAAEMVDTYEEGLDRHRRASAT